MRRRAVLSAVLLTGTLAPTVTLAGSADGDTLPRPLRGAAVGTASVGGPVPARVDVFYTRGHDDVLVARRGHGNEALGGVLTSGVSAVAMSDGTSVGEAVHGRGADGAVWVREFDGGDREWLPWRSLGGSPQGAPAVTTVGDPPTPVVYVRGPDDQLWRRTPEGWGTVGGRIITDPAGMAPTGGAATPGEEVFAIGADEAVWTWRRTDGWTRIGGRSRHRPAATLLPDGGANLFIVDTTGALRVASRPAGGGFGGFRRVGGAFTSPPTAVVDTSTLPAVRRVYGLGADHQLYRFSDVLGGDVAWVTEQVP